MPASVMERAAFVEDQYGDLVSPVLLTVSFEVHATQSQKQDAIRSVSGLVVGGAAGSVEGLDVVEVDGDGMLTTIESIAGRLRDLPQVRDAHPFSLMRSR